MGRPSVFLPHGTEIPGRPVRLQVMVKMSERYIETGSETFSSSLKATPSVAFKLDEKVSDPVSMYLSDIFTITCNLTGLPGISVPCGKNTEGLPIGLQLIANHFQERLLLRVAHHFEKAGGIN